MPSVKDLFKTFKDVMDTTKKKNITEIKCSRSTIKVSLEYYIKKIFHNHFIRGIK